MFKKVALALLFAVGLATTAGAQVTPVAPVSPGWPYGYPTITIPTGGVLKLPAGTAAAPPLTTTGDTDTGLWFPAANQVGVSTGGVNMATFGPSLTGSQATSALAITQTWNTTGAPTAILANITDTASAAGSLLMDLQVGSVSKFSVSKDGVLATNSAINAGASIYAAAGSSIGVSSKFRVNSATAGIASITTWASDNFTRLNLGPATSLFPALSVTSAATPTLTVIAADGSGASNFAVTGDAVFGVAGAANSGLYAGAADGYIILAGGSSKATGASVIAFGQSHATLANVLDLRITNVTKARLHASGGFSIGNTTDPGAGSLGVSGTLTVSGLTLYHGDFAAPPDGNTSNRRLVVGSASAGQDGEVVAAANATSAGSNIGSFWAANYSISGAEKRIAGMIGAMDGAAINSGKWIIYTASAGALSPVATFDSAKATSLAGTLTVVGTVSLFGNGSVALNSNSVDGAPGTDVDNANLYLNYHGYAGGYTRDRNTIIADGKSGTVATFTGSTKATTLAGTLTVSGAGPHAIGGATSTTQAVRVIPVFTGSSAGTYGLAVAPTLTNTNLNGALTGSYFSSTFNEDASGAMAQLTTVYVDAATVTAGGATVANTASLYVAGAMSATVTGANYAVWVAAGNVRIASVASASGTRYVCADTLGVLSGSASACSGTDPDALAAQVNALALTIADLRAEIAALKARQ